MSTSLRKVLVFGATGLIGRIIVNAILDSSSLELDRIGIFTSNSTVVKKPQEIESLRCRGTEIFVGDIENDEDLKKAFKEYDTVISCLGRNMLLAQIRLLDLAEESHTVKRFYPSEFGTDIEYNATSAQEKPHQAKLQVRKWFKIKARRLEYTYLVTGPYADLYLGKFSQDERAGSFDVDRKRAVLLGSGNEPVGITTMNDVGKFVVASLKHPAASRNRAIKVNSFTVTPHEILKEFERQTFPARWEVTFTSLDVLKELESAAYRAGNPLAAVYTLRRIWTEGGTLYDALDNRLIGMSETDSLEVAVRDAIATAGEGFRSGEL